MRRFFGFYRGGTASRAIVRVWLSATLIVNAAASLACHRSETSGSNREITVSAAVSLRDAFRDIGNQFERRKGVRINFNFGASGALQKQIESGAPVDVFASAGMPQMDALVTQGLIVPETRRDFARNTLVLVVPRESRS